MDATAIVPARRPTGWLVFLVAAIVAVVAVAPLAIERWTRSSGLEQWQVDQARLTLIPEGATVDHGAGLATPVAVTLPDPWRKTHPGFGGVGKYEFVLPLAQDNVGDRALFIPRVSNNGTITVNGDPVLESAGTLGESMGSLGVRWRWNRPLYLLIPASKLHAGDNKIVVSVTGIANTRAGLSEIFVGPVNQLYPVYRLREFLQIDLPLISNVAVIALAIPLLFSWSRDPRGSANYGLLSSGSFLFALRNLLQQLDFIAIPIDVAMPLLASTLGWSVTPMWVFLLRFSDYRWPRFERFLTLFTILGTAVLLALPAPWFTTVAPWIWYVPLEAIGVFCVGAFTFRTITAPTTHRLIVVGGYLALIAPAVHDVLWIVGIAPFSSIVWSAISFPLQLVLISIVLADDLAKVRAALAGMNRVLEARVADARAELERLYQRRRASEREAVSTEERLRLMREMHDGVGTRLSLLLSGLNRGAISTEEVTLAVQGSLEELHLLLDARGPSTTTLIDALANFRYRLEPRLAAAGVETRWEVGDDAEKIVLSAEATLHVLRITQECISNAVRHGHARIVTLKVDYLGELSPDSTDEVAVSSFEVMVIDDGVGLEQAAAATKGSGRGLANIKARADALGGVFSLRSGATGTVARLTVCC